MAHANGKRGFTEFERDSQATPNSNQFGVGQTLSAINGTGAPLHDKHDGHADGATGEVDGSWHVVKKRGKKKRKPNSDADAKDEQSNYPSIKHSSRARLENPIGLGDLQQLVLYLLANGSAPQWISVNQHHDIPKVVILMVPGLERGMFDGSILLTPPPNAHRSEDEKSSAEHGTQSQASHGQIQEPPSSTSPDSYYPYKLTKDELSPSLEPLADVFQHLWPVKAQGDSRVAKVFSPIAGMLQVPIRKTAEQRKLKGPQPPPIPKGWMDKRTPVTAYLSSLEELRDNEYTIHPASLPTDIEKEEEMRRRTRIKHTPGDGWIDINIHECEEPSVPEADSTNVVKDLTAGRDVFAIDCEMCMAAQDKFVVTRVSIVAWDGSVVLDELVKPDEPIVNYLTQFSGITKEKLDSATATLSDIHAALQTILTPKSILIGHSLNSDLDALKITHPHTIDTSLLYPHVRGPPYKNGLKFLAQKFLSREIQTGQNGHNPIEDATAALDLVKRKCEKGPAWGTFDATTESIFKRVAQYKRNNGKSEHCHTSAVVDWGFPKRGYGSTATTCINCESDSDVVDGIKRVIQGDDNGKEVTAEGVDLVWARFRELEAIRGWWNNQKTADNDALPENVNDKAQGKTGAEEPNLATLSATVASTTSKIKEVYESLPPCTAFIVYTGTGDPRELSRLHTLQQQFKREFAVKKWDELSVQWTDTEEQAQKRAAAETRKGLGFLTVK